MKALTLTQPWASLVALGLKHIETRSWSTGYRGPLAIHAAKGFPNDCKELCIEEPFRSVLLVAGIGGASELPRGEMIATAKLLGCVRIVHPRALIAEAHRTLMGRDFEPLTDQEMAFGDYTPGRYAWVIGEVQMLEDPIVVKGALGLWEWTNDCPHVGCQRPMPHEHKIEGPVQA